MKENNDNRTFLESIIFYFRKFIGILLVVVSFDFLYLTWYGELGSIQERLWASAVLVAVGLIGYKIIPK